MNSLREPEEVDGEQLARPRYRKQRRQDDKPHACKLVVCDRTVHAAVVATYERQQQHLHLPGQQVAMSAWCHLSRNDTGRKRSEEAGPNLNEVVTTMAVSSGQVSQLCDARRVRFPHFAYIGVSRRRKRKHRNFIDVGAAGHLDQH